MLARKRIDMRLGLLQIAQADGEWSMQDVAGIESERKPDPTDARRYVRALVAAVKTRYRADNGQAARHEATIDACPERR